MATLSAGFRAQSDWVRLAPEGGRFSVLMPGPDLPKDAAETKTDPRIGQYTTHIFMKKADKGVFLAAWVDYPTDFKFDVQSEINANRDNFINGLKARVTSESAIKLDGNPGMEFIAETDSIVFKSRIYIVGQRPYMIVAGTYKGIDDSENVGKFLSSFELKNSDR
jgi:hypothetical protein